MASGNNGGVAPFVSEQVAALRREGCVVEVLAVVGHGASGYLRQARSVVRTVDSFRPDVVHAHYGLCGLLATFQRRVPVVVTYHGSDLNDRKARPFSLLATRRAAHNIFVSRRLEESVRRRNSSVVPCGVDFDVFSPRPQQEARALVGWSDGRRRVLFAGAFDNPVKNAPLARRAVELVDGAELVEMKGLGRSDVAARMNAADALLLTSLSEGSPQVVKEALAVGLPVVSVDVGDVAELLAATGGGLVAGPKAEDLAAALRQYLEHPRRTNARQRMAHLDNRQVARRLMEIYQSVMQR